MKEHGSMTYEGFTRRRTAGLRDRLPCFIEGFLRNRNICVCLISCLSDLHEQEMGVPQESILSVTLLLYRCCCRRRRCCLLRHSHGWPLRI